MSSQILTPTLVGDAKEITLVNKTILAVSTAPLLVNVLIEGETGTGKEVVARALHHYRHHTKQFFAVNCSLFRGETLVSELFGYMKGSFTGAVKDKDGILKSLDKAGGGTLFLDELHDMPLEAQPALLRLLENWEYRPLGSNDIQEIKHKPLIIAAMQPGLKANIRKDLLNRIAEISINLPPLTGISKKGIETIVVNLIKTIISEFTGTQDDKSELRNRRDRVVKELDYELMAQHDWKEGNVRALRNYLKKCLVTGEYSLPSSQAPIPQQEQDIPQEKQDIPLFAQIPATVEQIKTTEEIEASYIAYVMEKFPDITQKQFKARLGRSIPTLRKKRKDAGVKI